MKSAMQELIEYLDPIHSGIKDKAIKLLEKEKEQLFEFWNGGINSTEEGGKSFDQFYEIYNKYGLNCK